MGETIREHYVPKGYLRKFSQDGTQVFRYDIEKQCEDKLLGINDICVKKHLYEGKTPSGEFIERGVLESHIKIIEDRFYDIRNHILKVVIKSNIQPQCLLKKEEKEAIRDMIALQIVRRPQIIQMSIDLLSEYGVVCHPTVMKKYALDVCLPLCASSSDDDKSLWDAVKQWTDDMTFIFYYDEQQRWFTSDSPVALIHSNKDNIVDFTSVKPEHIFYPITSSLLLYMTNRKDVQPGMRNAIIEAKYVNIEEIQRILIICANRWIIDKGPNLNAEILRLIDEERSTANDEA